MRRIAFIVVMLLLAVPALAVAPNVALVRADAGIQPQAAVDGRGRLQLVYYKGDAGHGDLFHVVSTDGGKTFGKPIAVNSTPGSAIAAGNIRGAHLTIGKNDRPIVGWMGSDNAKKATGAASNPMMVTRLADDGAAFEKERNVMGDAAGLDGGGSVAADTNGNVYVVWHARGGKQEGEETRCVWIAASRDEGKTYAAPTRATREQTGACGCCGMRAIVDGQGRLLMAYRSAKTLEQRDMLLLTSAAGAAATAATLQPWPINACPMSSAGLATSGDRAVVAWETSHQVSWGSIDAHSGKVSKAISPAGQGKRRFPAVAINNDGWVLLAWTDGVAWKRGGQVSWAVFDADGKELARKDSAGDVAVWSLVSAVALPDGRFIVAH